MTGGKKITDGLRDGTCQKPDKTERGRATSAAGQADIPALDKGPHKG